MVAGAAIIIMAVGVVIMVAGEAITITVDGAATTAAGAATTIIIIIMDGNLASKIVRRNSTFTQSEANTRSFHLNTI